jgi:hypothetical protein
VSPVLMVAVLAAVFVADHPALFPRYRNGRITLDRAYPDENELRARLEDLLRARIHRAHVVRLDLVDDTTVVDVAYRLHERTDQRDSYLTAEFEVTS